MEQSLIMLSIRLWQGEERKFEGYVRIEMQYKRLTSTDMVYQILTARLLRARLLSWSNKLNRYPHSKLIIVALAVQNLRTYFPIILPKHVDHDHLHNTTAPYTYYCEQSK